MYLDLFKSTKIGDIDTRNHFVRSATAEGRATEHGLPTEDIKALYMALAKSDVGTIITSYSYIADYEQPAKNQLGIYSDESIPYYKDITDAVHALNGKIVMQIVHGSSISQAYPRSAKILGPSAVVHPSSGLIPKEMDLEDMKKVKGLFANAARRAKEAGFDGVQIHCAHGYLLAQFLSPILNKRKDDYGGSWRNRIRFAEEVYQAVRQAVGNDFPVWIKINSSDEMEGGLSVEDFLKMATHLAQQGIDAFEVSGEQWSLHRNNERAYYKDAAVQLAERVDVPVILTGGLREKADIENIAGNSKVQFFGFARPFLRNINFLETLR